MTGCSSGDKPQAVTLKYGKGTVALDLSGAASVEWLYGSDMPRIDDLQGAFERAVEADAVGAPLKERLSPGDRVTIVISDITRFWMRQDRICEMLLKYLESACGIRDEDVCVLVALGTHRKQTPEELEKVASTYVYKRVRVVNHDCDAPDLVRVGVTSGGNPIEVNPLVVGRKVLVISGTVHHLMAGYGGGRKSILPGVSGRETIRRNHRLSLDETEPRSSEWIGSGKLTDNPLNEDMIEAAAMVAPVFGISIVVNTEGQHSALFCGDFEAAWRRSCAYCQRYYGRQIDRLSDVVVASCGGYPKDLNLYQGVKSLLNGINAMKPGGTFVFLCECPEGGGAPDFFDWTKPLSEGVLDPALRQAFTIAGYIFYASCEAIARAGRFLMLSRIDPALVKDMKIEAYNDLSELTGRLDVTGKSVTVIPYGGYVLPQKRALYDRLNREFEA